MASPAISNPIPLLFVSPAAHLDDSANEGPNLMLTTAAAMDPIYHHASHSGLRTLWVVFVLMVLAAISFTFLSWNVPVQRRVYHIITTIITLTAAVSYFAMATGHATTYACTRVRDSHKHKPDTYHDVCRQVFWVRYVDWSITTPLMILDLCLLAGVDGAHTLMAIVADIFMMLTGLFAAIGRRRSVQRWGWFIIACLSYVFVIWHVALHGTKAAKARGDRVSKLFGSLATFTLVLWVIYPM